MLVMLTIGVTMSGCRTKSREIDFEIGFNGANMSFSQNLKSVVKTFPEWNALRENNPPSFIGLDTDSGQFGAEYDEHFFIENALIVFSFIESNGIYSTQITNIKVRGKKAIVTANITLADSDVMGEGLVLLEVKKSAISNVNSVSIVRIIK